MDTVRSCPTCGERIQASVGECLFCPPEARPQAPPPAPTITAAPAVPVPSPVQAAPSVAPSTVPAPAAPAPIPKDVPGLLFEGEEAMGRGEAERALVLASRAVKEQPDSLAARALYERARQELLRGMRRERLEARVREAQRMLEGGDYAGAQRIVGSALKLVPDHAVALDLFSRLRARRLSAGTAEAQAERELHRLAEAQARQAREAARKAMAQGWERRALLAVRRGLRVVPDDPDLLALLRELQGEALTDPQRVRRKALLAQVRAAMDVLREGRREESLRMLRAVLRDDPDNLRAQAAIQEVRREWLRRDAPKVPAAPPPMAAKPAPPPRAAVPAPATVVPAAQVSAPAPALPVRVPPTPLRTAPPPPSIPPPAPTRPAATPRAETQRVLAHGVAPATPRRPVPLIAIVAAVVLVLAVGLALTRDRTVPAITRAAPSPLALAATPAMPPPTTSSAPTPLDGLDPELRSVVEETLAGYGRALETQDAALLERVRPDLGPRERRDLLARFRGALNAATDLRVLDVEVFGRQARAVVLRTDVIVGGREGAGPVEEVLHFERRGAGWSLRAAR